MPTPDRTVQRRGNEGIDRTADSRISNPDSWHTTLNMYSVDPGILASRPGSRVHVSGAVVYLPQVSTSIPTLDVGVGEVDPNVLPGIGGISHYAKF